MSNKHFKKLTCRFNEEALEYLIDTNKLSFGLKSCDEYGVKMFEEINRKCENFKNFKKSLRFRTIMELSFYILFPIVFILAIAGFESGINVFGLAWFFIGFFIIYIMLMSVMIYFISAKTNEYFNNYSLLIQEIINDYNRRFFIKNHIYASFRFQSFDVKGKTNKDGLVMKSNSLSKDKEFKGKNNKGISFTLKSVLRSNLMRILRIRFWIEFLIKEEDQNMQIYKNPVKNEQILMKNDKNEYYGRNVNSNNDRDYEEKKILKVAEDDIKVDFERESEGSEKIRVADDNPANDNFDIQNNDVHKEDEED